VPYCEVGVDEPIICQLLGREIPKEKFWEAGEYTQNPIEVEREVSRILGRDHISCQFRPPIPAHKHAGKGNILFYGEGMVKSEEDLDLIQLPDPYDDRYYEPAKRLLAGREDFATFAICRLGISPTYLCMGTEAFWIALYEKPGFVDEVLRRYSEWSAAVVERVVDLGFDVILMADDIAFKTGPYFPPEVFRELILPRVKRVAEQITIPWIYHSDGNFLPIMEDLLSLGMSGLHPIEPDAMDIVEVKRQYGNRVCVCGNINVNTLSIGTPDDVREEVKERLRTVAPGGGYMMSSGNSLTSYCRIENIRAMVETLREFGGYPIVI
jgi:uroporphyrinogen decarboxylase